MRSEQCQFCLQLYDYAMESRCVLCDEAVCPFCVIVIREGRLCFPCSEVSDARAHHVES